MTDKVQGQHVFFRAEAAYIIRSSRTRPTGALVVRYYMTPAMWTSSPADATIFRDWDAASAHLNMFSERDSAPGGWHDGSREVFDIVTLYGEMTSKIKEK